MKYKIKFSNDKDGTIKRSDCKKEKRIIEFLFLTNS